MSPPRKPQASARLPRVGAPGGWPVTGALVQKAELSRNQAFQISGKASDWSFDVSIDFPRAGSEEHWRNPQARP